MYAQMNSGCDARCHPVQFCRLVLLSVEYSVRVVFLVDQDESMVHRLCRESSNLCRHFQGSQPPNPIASVYVVLIPIR